MAITERVLQLILAVFLLCATLTPALAEGLSGTFYGVDEAAGASIEIRPDPGGFRGTFFDAQGNSQKFSADRNGDAAEAVLGMGGRTVLMRVSPLPFGVEVVVVPFDEAGKLVPAEGWRLSFVRAGLTLPKPGPEFIPPPKGSAGRVTANGFLASYQFWSPTGVRDGYLAMADRSQTLIRLFPAVQLDVIWKLCLAPDGGRALALALRGQGVSCKKVIEGIAAAQRTGAFDRFKAEVAAELGVLRPAVHCAEGFPESKATCDRAARELSKQAISLDTAATVLARHTGRR